MLAFFLNWKLWVAVSFVYLAVAFAHFMLAEPESSVLGTEQPGGSQSSDAGLADSLGTYSQGLANLRENRLDDAIRDFSSAIEREGTFAPAYLWRGTALGMKGDQEAAIRDLDAALKLDPTLWGAYRNRAIAHLNRLAF
ncbi:MAG TPA: hypothetical protein P5076_23890, partial [Myxococcota bacterium]|nr:hypothetical protein [Myxococcota bacterium]